MAQHFGLSEEKMFIKDKMYDLSVAVHQKIHRNADPKKPKRLNRRKIGERVFLCVMLAYPVLQFLVFYVVVNINSVLLAFKTFSGDTGGYYFNGLINFKNVIYTLSHDTAIAGSFGRGLIMYACSVIIGIPLHLAVAYLLYKTPKEQTLLRFSFALLIAGAVGNIIDRVRFGYVIDFFSFPNFPVFNVADCCVTAAIALIIIATLLDMKKEKKEKRAESEK